MSTLCLHDVSKVTIKRSKERNWTTLVIEHESHGYGLGKDEGFQGVRTETEITLHHNDLPKLPVRTGS